MEVQKSRLGVGALLRERGVRGRGTAGEQEGTVNGTSGQRSQNSINLPRAALGAPVLLGGQMCGSEHRAVTCSLGDRKQVQEAL